MAVFPDSLPPFTHMALVCVVAVLLDQILGESRRWHPLVGFGRLAHWVERWGYGSVGLPPGRRRLRGGMALAILVMPPVWLAAVWPAGVSGMLLDVLVLYLVIGAASLASHARAVQMALLEGDMTAARAAVGRMVSRDTDGLSEEAVSRATVESVLENGNDAIFGALFWFVAAGAPGALAYRLVNTLDAMWGYRTERYLHFGWAAARLDDLMNWIPARMTAFTYAILGKTQSAWRCWHQQAGAWESPNAGPVMAAGGGALGVRLGGSAVYHGETVHRPVLGGHDFPQAKDIARAIRLVRQGMWLWLLVLIAASIGGRWFA